VLTWLESLASFPWQGTLRTIDHKLFYGIDFILFNLMVFPV
jgi:hypothetical protein